MLIETIRASNTYLETKPGNRECRKDGNGQHATRLFNTRSRVGSWLLDPLVFFQHQAQ